MEAITAIFDIDLTGLVPELDALTVSIAWFARLLILIGPVLMLIFGYLYLVRPPEEANRKFGFRIWFGMGSVQAWRYTQRLAGLVFGGLGLALTVIMLVIAIVFAFQSLSALATTTLVCLICEAVLTLIAFAAVNILVITHFDHKGNRK